MAPVDSVPTYYLALRGHGRPNPATALLKAAGNYVTDAIYIYTSPLRMSGDNIVTLGLIGSIGVGLYAVDDDVYQGFQRSRENPTYNRVVIQTGGFFEPLGLMAETTPYLQGAAIAGWVFDIPLLRTIPGEILESNSIVGYARQPIERAVGRPRPSSGAGPRVFRKGGDSFPSGHASVICETAAILSHHAKHPVARSAIWAATATVLLQRVDEPGHNHWPADVWIGAALGTWAGHTVATRNEERRQGFKQKKWYDVIHRPDPHPEFTVLPVVSPEFTGLAVRARF